MKKKLIREVLDNGLTVLIQEKPDIPSVSSGIGSRFGTVHHPAAHFLEHMIFKGSRERKYAQIFESIKQWGGYLEGFSQFYSTLFVGKMLSRYTCSLIEPLYEIIRHPAFSEPEIELEKSVMEREVNATRKNPEAILRIALYETLFEKHPARNAVKENLDLIKTIRREDLMEIHQQFCSPERLIAVSVGNINLKGFFKQIEKYFAKVSRGIAIPLSPPREKSLQKTKTILLDLPSNDECFWMLGFRAPLYSHKDYYVCRLISAILGDSINSIFFREIREKRGLTYNIRSYYGPPDAPWGSRLLDDCSSWHGVFRVYSQFRAADLPVVQKIVKEEFEKLASREIEETELQRKQTMLIGQRILGLEGTLRHLWLLFMAEVNNNLADFENFEKNIFAVTPEEIKKIAKKYFSFDKSVQVIM
jgi:predicted Zn-dependent peptidase